MNFSDVLASSVHDIKNALSMVTNTLDELVCDPSTGLADNPKVARLEMETQRVNNNLIQLLVLYKSENKQLSINIDEHNVDDFISDVVVEFERLANAQGITLESECDPFLSAYFDEDLMRGVLSNAISNAQRYTKDKILISADEVDGHIVLRVEDNGSGYPESMLEIQAATPNPNNFGDGHTQLGLYFSNLVASLHKNNDKQGFIRLENRVNLDGGCLSVWIP